MPTFQNIVIYTSVTLLIIILIIVAINIHSAKKAAKWPPVVSDCPDYWSDNGTGGSKCTINDNNVNLGKATSPMDFSLSTYTGANQNCNRYKWALSNDVSWDGLTYGVQNPCAQNKL